MILALTVATASCAPIGTNPGGGEGFHPPEDILRPVRPADLTTGTVVWIHDGDSIDIETDQGTLKVRLRGVNSPERDECFSDEARDYLIQRVKGHAVGVEMGDVDQFDRLLAHVWLDDELVNLTLVAMGMATARTPDDSDPYGNLVLDAEELAFQDGLGLWSSAACGTEGSAPPVRFDLSDSQVDPPGPDDENPDAEYIVLVNEGTEVVDVSGWILRDESSRNRLEFAPDTKLGPGHRLEISSGCSTEPAWCGDRSIWNNDGDMAILLDQYGRVIARARY